VLVIIDDSEAKGFMFSYDKLFGVKDLSDTDKKNRIDGKETSVERTQRLFYVTCTRAKNSLAVVMYTDNPQEVKKESIRKGWFDDKEIIIM
jgi:DNA helicase-2/ATP-dependent DNA helicase PcrA